MGLQIVVGAGRRPARCIVAGARRTCYNTRLIFPFFKQLIPDLGWCYVPFAVFVLVARDATPST